MRLSLEDTYKKLDAAKGREEMAEAALEARVWRRVIGELERIPQEIAEELGEEGDKFYGQ